MKQSSEQQEAAQLEDFIKDLRNSYEERGISNLNVGCVVGHDGRISIKLNGVMPRCFDPNSNLDVRVGEKVPVGFDFKVCK